MPKLETILWELYKQGDSRISVLESFQSEPYTYVKVFVDDGTHGITVQEITNYPYPFSLHADKALKDAVRAAIEKVSHRIAERLLIEMAEEFPRDLM